VTVFPRHGVSQSFFPGHAVFKILSPGDVRNRPSAAYIYSGKIHPTVRFCNRGGGWLAHTGQLYRDFGSVLGWPNCSRGKFPVS